MNLKEFACKVATSFLIFGSAMTFLPAENISFVPTAHAALYSSPDSANEYAIKMYTEDIQKNPKDANAYFMRGSIYNLNKQIDKAIEDFSMYIRLEPNDQRGHLNRGIAYRDIGQYDKAIKDFNKAISLDSPDTALNYINRAKTY